LIGDVEGVRSCTSRSFFTPHNQNQQNLSSLCSPEPETQDLLTPRNQTQSLLLAPRNPEPKTFLPPCQSRTQNLPSAVPIQNVPDSSRSELVVPAAACRYRTVATGESQG